MRVVDAAVSLALTVGLTVVSSRAGIVAAAPGIEQIRVDTGRIPIRGGSLYYEAAGRGPAVVLLHSGNLDSRTWDPQFLPLARAHRAIPYGARGLGRSSPADVPYAAHDDLLALLDSLRISRPSLVGISG